jgi:hypothetical protein
MDGSNNEVFSALKVNGDSQTNGINPASRPTRLRVVKSSSIVYVYYYLASWVLIDSRDFGGREDNITNIKLIVADASLHGGYVEFDNLLFTSGCPDGYPKAWTTTTSTTTTTTTTV